MNMNRKDSFAPAREYIAPQVDVVALVTENFTLASTLEDYDENIICAPGVLGLDSTDALGL